MKLLKSEAIRVNDFLNNCYVSQYAGSVKENCSPIDIAKMEVKVKVVAELERKVEYVEGYNNEEDACERKNNIVVADFEIEG